LKSLLPPERTNGHTLDFPKLIPTSAKSTKLTLQNRAISPTHQKELIDYHQNPVWPTLQHEPDLHLDI
jgi:hypothetical protein